MSTPKQLPKRDQVRPEDTWDLSSLFPDDDAWEAAFGRFEQQVPQYEQFRGQLADPQQLAACLKFDSQLDRLAERLGDLRLFEDHRGPGQQRVPADAGAVSRTWPRGPARRPATFVPSCYRWPGSTAAGVAGAEVVAALPADARTPGPLQAAHVGRQGGRAAGDAGRDGAGRRPGLSAAARCRHEVRHAGRRAGRGGRAEQCDVRSVPASRQSASVRAQAFRQYYQQFDSPRKHAGRHAQRLDPEGHLLRPRAEYHSALGCGPVSRQRAAYASTTI